MPYKVCNTSKNAQFDTHDEAREHMKTLGFVDTGLREGDFDEIEIYAHLRLIDDPAAFNEMTCDEVVSFISKHYLYGFEPRIIITPRTEETPC